MRKVLAATTAAVALMVSASGAIALDDKTNMYVTGEGENRMVMGGDNAEGSRLLMGENGAAPSECPEGSFYMIDEQIFACGDDSTAYTLREPESGTMSASGDELPEGAMMLEARENPQQ